MKQILKLVFLLVIGQTAFGQAPSNYTNINGRYRWIAGMFDSTFHIPKGSTPSLRTGGSTNSGGLFYNTSDSSFKITGTEDDPAVLIQLYRDGKPTETKVGHKMSTLKKNSEVTKHGSHDQSSHGAWANGKYNPDDSEGEDSPEPKNDRPYPKFPNTKDDSEGEFEELDADDPRWMDDMDIMRPSRITPSQRYTN